MAGSPWHGQPTGNGLVEVERARAATTSPVRPIRIGSSRRRSADAVAHLAMAGRDPALVAAFQHGMRAISAPSSKIWTSSASVCTSTIRWRVASGTL